MRLTVIVLEKLQIIRITISVLAGLLLGFTAHVEAQRATAHEKVEQQYKAIETKQTQLGDVDSKGVIPTPPVEPTLAQKIEQNVNKCDLNNQYISAENATCIDKPVAPVDNISAGSVPQAATNIEQIIVDAANRHGVDAAHLLRIARCESGLNPSAVNYNYYENGHPSGLFQHISGYFPSRAAQYGYSPDVFDAYSNANVTAAMFANGQSYLWECN